MAGKGSKQRPMSVSNNNFSDNWDAIFKKKEDAPVIENEISTQADNEPQDKSDGTSVNLN